MAVEAFLTGSLPFVRVVDVIASVLDEHDVGNVETLDDVEHADTWARRRAEAVVTGMGE